MPDGFQAFFRSEGGYAHRSVVAALQQPWRKKVLPDNLAAAIATCLGDEGRRVMPITAEATAHGVHRQTFQRHTSTIAAAVHFGARVFAASFASHLAALFREKVLEPMLALTF